MTDLLHRHEVDVLCVQETKCTREQFPTEEFTAMGYEVAHLGTGPFNGVAILSRVGLEDVTEGFPGQPGFAKDPAAPQLPEARALGATCGGVRVWSLYVPNGREIADPHYTYKLRWLGALRDAVTRALTLAPRAQLLLTGDFNVIPREQDAWDPSFFVGATHVTEPERAAYQALEEAGLEDVSARLATNSPYTYWDYQAGRWPKNEGIRIDAHLASTALAQTAQSGFVDLEERGQRGTSDHAPLILDYAVAPDFDSVR